EGERVPAGAEDACARARASLPTLTEALNTALLSAVRDRAAERGDEDGRGADGALVRRAGAEAPLISSEAAEALQIRPFRDVEVVIVAVDLPTVIAVGEPGDPQTLSDASIEDGTDPLATPEIGDVVANAQLETATESLAGDEAAGRDDIVVAQSTTEEPAFLSEAEDA
ncbi:MAG: hypothetical protein AAFM91_19640, partial [Pseudomonadota bacterium]